MLKGEDIICISSIDWDFIWQGHQEIMSTFAKNGNRVLFIENTGVRPPSLTDIQRLKKRIANWFKSVRGFREEMNNLYVYSPIILPFPYSKIARYINRYMLINPIRRWMKIMEFHEPIIWTFLPTGTAIDIINDIDRKLLVYYCIADFYELVNDPKKIRQTEDELIRKSDVIFAQGNALKEKCEGLNKNVHIFPFGVNIETFSVLEDGTDIPDDIKDIKRPVIGYVGGIHRHMDFGLIKFMAQSHPDWSIVLVGPVQADISAISNLTNIYLLGKRDFSTLPNYVDQFDVCIIPYEVSGYTTTVFPTKLNEYHAMGKPVVSTNLPEIVNFNNENDNIVLVGKTHDEFIERISGVLDGKAGELREQRIESAKKHGWAARIEKMGDLMGDAIAKKTKSSADWKERFLKFYIVSRKRALKIASLLGGMYLLIFCTPIVWSIAEPLNISEAPRKADCIVVFGGGVGESGKAGQGYEERVGYAVELYKKGYADRLIFSSGYMYVFKETLVMKGLAISLGVPERAVILEDAARNTYENVAFTKKILDREKWKKILLVSSPYHMRRVSLVFDKIAKDVQVTYTPLPQSSFYSHVKRGVFHKQIDLRQIKGIVHEYLAIIYYYLNGDI